MGNNLKEVDEMNSSEESESDLRIADVLRMIPIQDARSTGHKDLKVKRGRGRPRKVERAPQVSDLEYHAEMIAARHRFISSDPLVQAIEGKQDPIDILFQVKKNVAREASSLAFDQIENQKRGKDTSVMTGRRIEALRKIGEIELKIRELEVESINFTTERFQKVFQLFISKLLIVSKEMLPEESRTTFMSRFASEMANWEEEAAIIANKDKK